MNQPGRLIFHVPPIDMRGGDEIESELDEECAFHLDQSARDLKNEGRSSTEAAHEARARFGDVETIKRDCKRIAMKERIMLQRINLALMIVVLVVVGLVNVQMFTTQQYNTLALQAITADLAQIKLDGAVARNTGAVGSSSTPSTSASVLVQGAVERPGWYSIITQDGATHVHEVLQRAGVKEQMWFDGDGFALSLTDHYLAADPVLQVLKPGQEIRVYDAIPTRHRRASRPSSSSRLTPGLWREVDKNGESIEEGRSLVIGELPLDPYDPPWGELRNETTHESIRLEFCDASRAFMFDETRSRAFGVAKWGPQRFGEDWLLVINPSPTRSADAWIYFEHVASQTEEGDADNQPVSSLTIYGSLPGSGKYPFPESGELSVAEAIIMAGGPADAASTVEVKRELDGETQIVFAETFGTAGEMARMSFPLQPDDRVYLEPAYGYIPDEQPRVVGRVYLDGAVARIGVYDLYSGKGKTLLELLLDGGGVTQTPARVQVIRHNDQSGQVTVVDEVAKDIRQLTAGETLLQFDDHIVVSAVDTDDGG